MTRDYKKRVNKPENEAASDADLVKIGEICGTYGFRGALKVLPLTDFPERFRKMNQIRVLSKTGIKLMEVESAWEHQKFIIIKFKGVDSKETAALMSGGFLVIGEDEVHPLSEGTYYIYQLIGLEVWDRERGHLGKLVDVLQTGANDVYVVRSDRYGEVLVPAIKQVVIKVDLEAAQMEVNLLPGLVND